MAKDQFNRSWIIDNSLDIIPQYDEGILTLRALYYQLVARGMTNSLQHYKRVVAAMSAARRDGRVSYETFSDHDRQMIGSTKNEETLLEDSISEAKRAIKNWMEIYHKNRWENQPYYVEVWIEKKALQGVFESVCFHNRVALAACKGYPSLTFLNEAAERFQDAIEINKQTPLILYFGDYDATGEDIPRSIEDNLLEDFDLNVEVRRIALLEEQVLEMRLPPAPTKKTDSRAKRWNGLGQVELDAVDPHTLQTMCNDAIKEIFKQDLFENLKDQEEEERGEYVQALKAFVKTL